MENYSSLNKKIQRKDILNQLSIEAHITTKKFAFSRFAENFAEFDNNIKFENQIPSNSYVVWFGETYSLYF